jgi:lipoprotein signal peptidase
VNTHITAIDATAGWWRWLGISLIVIILDQISKAIMLGAFFPGEQRPITGFFSLVLTFNTGAAFSFLAAADGWQRLAVCIDRHLSRRASSSGCYSAAAAHPTALAWR